MYYIASLSGGVPSAVMAELAIRRYGRSKVWLFFADTLAEDEDLYRFVDDCMERWGGKLWRYCDGRTPEEVAEDLRIIPNQKIAPCTRILKIEPFTRWLWRVPKPVTVLLGFDWSEPHRIHERQQWHKKNGKWKRATGYQKMPGVYEDYPLLWKPIIFDMFTYCRDVMQIEIPRMYKYGFSHNNCRAECFRQGITTWLLTRDTFPAGYQKKARWELKMQDILGTTHTIVRDQSNGQVKPLTLSELSRRKRVRRQPGDDQQISMFEDRSNCLCGV